MWKFHDFSITQILREIKFGGSRSAKSAISSRLQALNSDFNEFLHFLNAEIYSNHKFKTPKMTKTAYLVLLDSQKLISRKI